MDLKNTGKVYKVLEKIGGTSKSGNEWKKGQFVLETGENFPKQVYCTAWGDMIDQVQALQPGDQIKASIDLQSREYNGRWYTDVKVWRLEKVTTEPIDSSDTTGTSTPPPPAPPEDTSSSDDNNSEDDLPF